jgi:hypothetical protein
LIKIRSRGQFTLITFFDDDIYHNIPKFDSFYRKYATDQDWHNGIQNRKPQAIFRRLRQPMINFLPIYTPSLASCTINQSGYLIAQHQTQPSSCWRERKALFMRLHLVRRVVFERQDQHHIPNLPDILVNGSV